MKLPPPPNNGPPWSEMAVENSFTFQSSFAMEAIIGAAALEPDLFRVILLPPSLVTAGVPVALTWVLERLGGVHHTSEIPYTIVMVRIVNDISGLSQP